MRIFERSSVVCPSLLALLGSLAAVAPALAVKPLHTLRGSEPWAQFGEAIEGVGDVDRDGFADFAAGEPMSDNSRGRVVVYSGRGGRPILEFLGALPGVRFGYSVAGPGDVDGDGVPDIAVGAPREAVGGRVHVYSGADGSVLYTIEGPESGALFGARVSRAGEVDGDGLEDLVVSAPGVGRVMVLSGATGEVLREHGGFQGIKGAVGGTHRVFSGQGDGEVRLVGRSAGDVDGDGFVDLLVGDTWAEFAAGKVYVFSGRDGSLLRDWKGKLNGTSYFGFSVDSLADIDGDGWREILIGASGTFRGPFYGGEIQIRSARTGELLRRELAPLVGHSYMGHVVRGIGDLDGDGHEDYLVGLPYRGPNVAYQRGSVWLFSGSGGRVLAEVDGPRKRKRAGGRPQFGYYANPLGDVDGDGVVDIGVGAPYERRGRGAVRIYSGGKLLRRGR